MKQLPHLLFLLFFANILSAQKQIYTTLNIVDSLKNNANAVVRLDQTDINIISQREMNIKTQRVVTVFNENGLDAINAFESYDKSTSIKSILATVFDAFGKEIKKIKRSDFKDQTATDGGTVFSDSRVIFLHYTPVTYPFTIVFESEITTSNTAFIPQWTPIDEYNTSIEKSILTVNFPNNLGFKKKECNFFGFDIKKTVDIANGISYTASNIVAQKYERYSPTDGSIFPRLMMGLESFHLEGVDGKATTWEEYGKWYYDSILPGTISLNDETKTKIKALVASEKDVVKIAKIVYNFVQQKSRYVSIQVGIGGWKPMLASDVDRLGYGDCKALSNYTKALLDAVNVPSYNTLLYGGDSKKSITSDFVSMQGNHMILCVPNGDKKIFLECTSQTSPFGYQGTFTDDREVLIVKPNGGEIVRTTIYSDKTNLQLSKGKYSLGEDGHLFGSIAIVSEGTQYNQKYLLETESPVDREKHYKEYWDNINNLKIDKLNFINDKEKVNFTENASISAVNYATITGEKMMFVVNVFNKIDETPSRIRNRKTPFVISRGYLDIDEIEIELPAGYSIEAMPNTFELKTKFGDYTTELLKKDGTTLVYKRTNFLKKGEYTKREYDEYRLFEEQISRNDNAKIILTKNK